MLRPNGCRAFVGGAVRRVPAAQLAGAAVVAQGGRHLALGDLDPLRDPHRQHRAGHRHGDHDVQRAGHLEELEHVLARPPRCRRRPWCRRTDRTWSAASSPAPGRSSAAAPAGSRRCAAPRTTWTAPSFPARTGRAPTTGSCRWRRRSWRSAPRQHGAQPERRGQRDAPAVLQPVQRRPDQRCDHRERRDGDEQVQRDLALALAGRPPRRTTCWPARPPSRRRRRSWRPPARSARSVRTCRRRRRWRRGARGRTSSSPSRGCAARRPASPSPSRRRLSRAVPTACGRTVMTDPLWRAFSSSGGSHRLALWFGGADRRAVR